VFVFKCVSDYITALTTIFQSLTFFKNQLELLIPLFQYYLISAKSCFWHKKASNFKIAGFWCRGYL